QEENVVEDHIEPAELENDRSASVTPSLDTWMLYVRNSPPISPPQSVFGDDDEDVQRRVASKERIEELKKENEEGDRIGQRFSRFCRICRDANCPLQRAVFSSYGHTTCLACAEQMKSVTSEKRKTLHCPFCRAEGGFVKLYEERIEDEPIDL
ncbi:hypothetical protein PENTCL1PPCAC_24344, partial [Pristionchus entomophagus]